MRPKLEYLIYILGLGVGIWLSSIYFFNEPVTGAFAVPKLAANRNPAVIRILCVVMVSENKVENLKAINDSFGERCDGLKFYGMRAAAHLDIYGFQVFVVQKYYFGTWQFFGSVMESVNEFMESNYDHVVFINDQTFVIMENLRAYIQSVYNDGVIARVNGGFWRMVVEFDAGVVLSRSALASLVGAVKSRLCSYGSQSTQAQGLYECLNHLSIMIDDARDRTDGGERLLMDSPRKSFDKSAKSFLPSILHSILSSKKVTKCCSDTAIMFGRLPVKDFYLLEHLLYGVQPVGISINLPIDAPVSR